jgi:hypothetical protein
MKEFYLFLPKQGHFTCSTYIQARIMHASPDTDIRSFSLPNFSLRIKEHRICRPRLTHLNDFPKKH